MLSAFKNHEDKFLCGILSAPMLGFKNERFLKTTSSLMNFFRKDTDYLIGSQPNMGAETPFEKNDLTSDKKIYKRKIRENSRVRHRWLHRWTPLPLPNDLWPRRPLEFSVEGYPPTPWLSL